MSYYPLFIDLSRVRVLIAGAGAVGARKAAAILASGPLELLWVDPRKSLDELKADLPDTTRLIYEQRPVTLDDLPGRGLVFACTDNREVNRTLCRGCGELGVPCNVVDAPGEGNFIVPSHFRQGDFLVAVSSGGVSPALTKIVRRELQNWLGDRYALLLVVLGRLRARVLEQGRETEENSEIFRSVAKSELGAMLSGGRMREAENLLAELLPPYLHTHIGELLREPF